MLSADEIKEFRWDVWEYIRCGQENELDGRWIKELENASARFHISRLEALKLQTQQSLEVMFGNQLDSVDAAMKRIYLDGYYHTAYELQKGFGIGWDIAGIDQSQVEKVISKPWAVDKKNFSERIWGNRQKLIGEVHNELTQNILLGADPQRAIDAIAHKMDNSRYNAGRLVMTEEAYFSSAAQKDCFQELGVEQYEIVATLDSHTSELCRSLDGKVFPIKDYQAGVTAPPFHVFCRSTTVPYFEDDFGQPGERAAKGEDGKTYYVPADMTYGEWKKAFADGGEKTEFDEVKQDENVHWTGKEDSDKISPMDITKEWTRTKGIKGTVIERQEYAINGTTYKVDGRHVILQPTKQEKEVAAILSGEYGKTVEFVPQVLFPQGIQTPDYLIDGERFDLKCLKSTGRNLIYNMVSKKKMQSPNFIFDITNCPLSESEIERQIKDVYASIHTKFIKKIVVMKEGKIKRVYDK